MAEKSEGKWAAEAFDFLRLYNRLGYSFTGLILLQIGWAAFAILLGKVGPDKPSPINIPAPWWPGGPSGNLMPSLRWFTVTQYAAGALTIVTWWIFASGVYCYVWGPLSKLARMVVNIALFALLIMLLLLNVVLLPITWPLERLLVRRWRAAQPAERLAELSESGGDARIEAQARYEILAGRSCVGNTMAPIVVNALRRSYSSARVGFAQLVSYSYAEDLQGARAPQQIFASAIHLARLNLREVGAAGWIRFKILPQHFRVLTPLQAAMVRWLFGLDVLLWGTYVSGAEGQIWMNFHYPLPPATDDADDDRKRPASANLFPLAFETSITSAIVMQDDPSDAYTVLLLAILQTLQFRKDARKREITEQLDRLTLTSEDRTRIMQHLLNTVFPSMPESRLSDSSLPSAKVVLTEIVSQWVGHQLGKYQKNELDEQAARNLYIIARKCADLLPRRADHHYRLGAIACLLGDADGAVSAFREANEVDEVTARGHRHRFEAKAWADMALKNADRTAGFEEKVNLACFAAHAARVVGSGDEYLLDSLDESIAASHESMLAKEPVMAITVVKRMVAEARDARMKR